MIKDVLRLKYEARLSHRQIALALGISKGVVAKYAAAAAVAGLADWALLSEIDEANLEARLLGRRRVVRDVAMPEFGRVHQELGRKGVTLTLLWEEYVAAHPGQRTWGRTQFCEHYRQFAGALKRSMRQVHRAGEKLFVDYAGPTVALRDGSRASVFVAAMGASSYTFACATPSQKLEDWIAALVRALHFLGGVPQLIVPDNARALIAEPDRYEPRAGHTVLDFARHYATSILPARPRSPRDKAKVESAVQVVERWILARLRHRSFDTVAQLDTAVVELLGALNNRPFQRLPGSRASAFAQIDQPALRPLPPSRYELARFKRAKVHIDYHVQCEGHFYSVPHALVGQEIELRLTAATVECLHRAQRVAVHVRSHRQGGYTTVAEHLPAAHRAHLEWTPSRLIEWGRRIGVACAELVSRMLAQFKHPEHGYRGCLGLFALERRYGAQRLEAACAVALQLGSCRYRSVREILAHNRDRTGLDAGTDWTSPAHENVRGPDYYQ